MIFVMIGDYKVIFDFIEIVLFVDGYELKDLKFFGGYEFVCVIEDCGEFISL